MRKALVTCCLLAACSSAAHPKQDKSEPVAQEDDPALDTDAPVAPGNDSSKPDAPGTSDQTTTPNEPPGGWGDGGSDDCEAFGADLSAFLDAHDACERDQDCVAVGACSGTPDGFYAVNQAAAVSAQALLNRTPDACIGFDGPIHDAVCSEGHCTRHFSGHYCGEPVPTLSDAGSYDAGW